MPICPSLPESLSQLMGFLGVEGQKTCILSSNSFLRAGPFYPIVLLGPDSYLNFYIKTELPYEEFNFGLVIDVQQNGAGCSLVTQKYVSVWTTDREWHEVSSFLLSRQCLFQYHPAWIQGSLVNIGGLGVLITGAPGSGKSTLVSQLLSLGARFVSDDIVECDMFSGTKPVARPVLTQYGQLSLRGKGLFDVASHFGDQVMMPRSTIDMVVSLDQAKAKKTLSICGKTFPISKLATMSADRIFDEIGRMSTKYNLHQEPQRVVNG